MRAKASFTSALAFGIGAVAGLRSMTAPALVSWALAEKMIRVRSSLLAPIISQRVSKRTVELALGELIADKLPFTRDRISPGPLAARVASGALCGAVVSLASRRPGLDGMGLGALGAVAGAVAGYYARKKLSNRMPGLAVALLEDAVAIVAGASIVWQLARTQE